MQITAFNQALQNFVWAIDYGKSSDIDVTTADAQGQVLDYLMELMQYCVRFDPNNIPKGLNIHPEFFALPCVEQFFDTLFANLHESLLLKAEAVFLRGLAFIVEYIGLPKSREVMHRLLKKLQKRFPALKERHDKAISTFIEEFFRPTVGEFLDQHRNAEKHMQAAFPAIHELFVAPLNTAPFRDRKLFNFYCNPWVYQRIMNYFAYYARLSSPTIRRDLLETSLQWLEGRLQIIRAQTNAESWKELGCKAQETLNHSEKLESFAIEVAGLAGEIKTAAQFIEDSCGPDDTLIFLPKLKGKPNCDLMVMRHTTRNPEFIECKAKTPRHGLDEKIAGEAQIWDDFFTNFSGSIYSYLAYLQETVQPPIGFTECFPLLAAYEGAGYAQALPLIEGISTTSGTALLKKWTAEQKVSHLLRALFLRPLVLDPHCIPLPSDTERLAQRQQDTRNALKKDWVDTLLKKATKQLKETVKHQKIKGHQVSKMYVALDLALSYRLTQDSFGNEEGNIQEVAAQSLQEAFQSFKEEFFAEGLVLELIIITP